MPNLILFGDSITEAVEVPPEARWPRLLEQALQRQRPGVWRVYPRGIGGNTTAQALDRFHTDVLPYLPGVVVFQFGFNDCNVFDWSPVPRVSSAEFRRNLGAMVDVVLARGGSAAIIINHLLGEVTGVQGNGVDYVENYGVYEDVLRDFSGYRDVTVIDLPAGMREAGIAPEDFNGADGIHLSDIAHPHYARIVLDRMHGVLMQFPDNQSR